LESHQWLSDGGGVGFGLPLAEGVVGDLVLDRRVIAGEKLPHRIQMIAKRPEAFRRAVGYQVASIPDKIFAGLTGVNVAKIELIEKEAMVRERYEEIK
jgi:hypothetical protein